MTDATPAPATVIAPGIRIRGDVTGGDSVDLAGKLEGDLRVDGLVRVRAGASLLGDLTAKTIVVEGELSGRSLVAEKVEIGAAARVRASIRAERVAIAEGASFEGQVQMDVREGGGAAPVGFQEKRKERRPEGDPSA